MITFRTVCHRPCPACRGCGPHALIAGSKRFQWGAYLLCAALSCGLGLVLAPFFYRGTTQAWCRACRLEFTP